MFACFDSKAPFCIMAKTKKKEKGKAKEIESVLGNTGKKLKADYFT